MRRAIVVGLTGTTGAGKSTVGEMLKKYGYAVIDADKIASLVLEKGSPVLKQIADTFGEDVLFEDGTLNRKLLAERAFSSAQNTSVLNQLTHPEIVRLIMKKVQGEFFNGYEAVILDAPQLFESGLDKKCNFIISVTASPETRMKRIMERDGISSEAAQRRMKVQLDDSFFRQNCDVVIVNEDNTDDLKKQVLYTARLIEEKISGEKVQ